MKTTTKTMTARAARTVSMLIETGAASRLESMGYEPLEALRVMVRDTRRIAAELDVTADVAAFETAQNWGLEDVSSFGLTCLLRDAA